MKQTNLNTRDAKIIVWFGQTNTGNLGGEQGRFVPLIPLTTSQLQGDEPEGTHSGDTNQAPNEIYLEEVLPERGPMTGGIHVAIFGENFPSTPLYVLFGENWVRAVSQT